MNVIKRDGRVDAFNPNKISNAIKKAFIEVDGCIKEESEAIINRITSEIENIKRKEMSVEDIQDIVVNKLMASSRKDVATHYVEYRLVHKMARTQYQDLIKAVSEKLNASNVQNQNANVDEYSFGGRMGEANDIVMKRYALDYCVSKMARENHLNNEIYIHDLSHYAVGDHNCLSIPFDDLLAKGFNTRQTDVRPAQSVNTAFQLVAVIFQLQSLQQFGGVSATHLDWTMVPYVRKSFYKHYRDGVLWCEDSDAYQGYVYWSRELEDKVYNDSLSIEDELYDMYPNAKQYALAQTRKEIHQAVEGMYHNLSIFG